MNIPRTTSIYTLYNYGSVIRLLGSDNRIEDVTIDGYGGEAIVVRGDRIRVINRTVRSAQTDVVPANIFPDQSKEIVPNGSGIRVYGSDVATSGDAVRR